MVWVVLDPHPLVVTARDTGKYIRVFISSHHTATTGWAGMDFLRFSGFRGFLGFSSDYSWLLGFPTVQGSPHSCKYPYGVSRSQESSFSGHYNYFKMGYRMLRLTWISHMYGSWHMMITHTRRHPKP